MIYLHPRLNSGLFSQRIARNFADTRFIGQAFIFALASSALIVACKKLDSKIKKHQEIVTLAIAKRDTVDRMVSKTLTDRQISDAEFQSIMTEYSQYHALREAVRAKFTRQTFRPDIEKIKKDLRGEVGEEFRKKNYSRL